MCGFKETTANKTLYQVIAACSFGTILEWYDFSIYAYLAPILALLFFNHEDHVTSLVLTYSVFAIGFLVRPVGAILFGHFGDRVGRKKVLVHSILLIAITTTLIGFLPTYKQVGIWAPILLVLLRLLQGLAIGGEVTGAGSFVFESTPNERKGFATSIIWASSGIGILLSSIVVSVTTFLVTSGEMPNWGWRIPFLLGAITGVIGYYLRTNTTESSQFMSMKADDKILKIPLLSAIKKFKREISTTIGLYVLSALITYLIFVYMPVYVSKIIGLPFNQAMVVNTFIMSGMVMFVPVMGYYSDIVGRRIILLISSAAFLLLAYPLYSLIARGNLLDLIIAQAVLAIIGSGYQGAITRAVLDMFPVNVRYSAAAFGYNLTYSLFGGTAPLIAIYLIDKLKFNTAPCLYLSLGAFISFFAAFKLRETNRLKSD